jgi:hypothetical protein
MARYYRKFTFHGSAVLFAIILVFLFTPAKSLAAAHTYEIGVQNEALSKTKATTVKLLIQEKGPNASTYEVLDEGGSHSLETIHVEGNSDQEVEISIPAGEKWVVSFGERGAEAEPGVSGSYAQPASEEIREIAKSVGDEGLVIVLIITGGMAVFIASIIIATIAIKFIKGMA